MLDNNNWNHLTVRKQKSSDPFKNKAIKKTIQIIDREIDKEDLALNNPQKGKRH